MEDILIRFKDIKWETIKPGMTQKAFKREGSLMRIVRFEEGFIEEEWCTKSHVGYVLDGAMNIECSGELIRFRKGDGIWIDKGVDSGHKVVMRKGQEVELVLFEKVPGHGQ